MSLTPSQQSAVDHDHNLILFAGPGSGKTSTSVAKGVKILANPSNRLCMITFTSAAAGEMRERMQHSLTKQGHQPPGDRFMCGTFHAITKNHYTRHARSRTNILMPNAQNGMISAMLASVDKADRKGYMESLGRYQGALNQDAVEIEDEAHKSFIDEYLRRLRASNSIDLSMAMRDCTLLIGNDSIPPLPVTHLIGDEMQDADEIQLELILHHSRRGTKCTLVADDDQTIYGWRSALGYEGLMRFGKETRCKTIRLEENFRSREEIVAHANQVIACNNPNRVEKNQRATRGPGGVLGQCGYGDINAQCARVATYAELFKAEGESMAVLARDNLTLQTMGAALNEKGIDYAIDGETLWDKPEVSTFLSTFQALVSGKTSALQPLISTWPLDPPLRNEFERALGSSAKSFLSGEVPDLQKATVTDSKFLTEAAGHFARWRGHIAEGKYNLTIDDVSHMVQLWYSNHINAQSKSASYQSRKSRENLTTAATVLQKLNGTLSQRMLTIARFKDKEKSPEVIQLMTIHKSKGLEFDTVFQIGASMPDDKVFDVEAERRLFFVAITRAKERYYVLYSNEALEFIHEAGIPYFTRFPGETQAAVAEHA